MKLLFAAVVCALFCCGNVRGEPAAVDKSILDALRVVEDPDGSSNLRSGPSTKSGVVGKVTSGSVVNIGESKADWVKLETLTDTEKPRYIHGSRLRKIDNWKQIPGSESKNKEAATAKHESIEAKVKSAPFTAASHKVAKDKEGGIKVDGHSIWGTDGGLPHRTLSLSFSLAGKAIPIPPEATRDLYEPNMESLVLLTPPEPAGPTLVLMQNSDGAGAYCVVWAFSGGNYVGRAVFGQN